ncbi:MAG: DUF4249 domain-containing protein [Chitinophagales bacterium]
MIALIPSGCKKPYEPKAITQIDNLLVVEGVINGNPNSPTTISLSRLRRLNDSSYNKPELNASVLIEEEAGSTFPLQERDSGYYSSGNLTLDASKKYRISISTSDGGKYSSDFTNILQTPPIDTITWEQNKDVTLYLDSHDPLNQTHYYRWDYVETWEYHSFFNTIVRYRNDTVVYEFNDQIHICWKSANSTEILLGSSVALSNDVISQAKIGTIPQNSQKGSERYSALVKQYALSQEAYVYWQILQKSSQQLGTLFDVQPSQLQGNIHGSSHSSEPVIGYISASTISEKRVFIDYSSLTGWKEFDGNTCEIIGTIPAISDAEHFLFSDGYYSPYYFVSGGGVTYSRTSCLDCRTQGGTTVKPPFW